MAIHPRRDGSHLTAAEKQALIDAVEGKVIFKGEATAEEYDPLTKRWNEAHTAQANIIALPESEADVTACINFANKHHLDVAVAGGRHAYYGASSSEGMVIDLRNTRNVVIDKDAMTVRAGGGCLARDVEIPCEKEGIMVGFGAINQTGIGGLTTGGGVGWLSGKYGLTIDNMLSARVALANGTVVTASLEENQDLFWGIRGGGCNFGIVVEFVFRAHSLGKIFFNLVALPPTKLASCIDLFTTLHQTSITSQGAIQFDFGLIAPHGAPQHLPTFFVFYAEPNEEEAKRLAQPIYDLEPLNVMGGVQDYTQLTGIYEILRTERFNRCTSSNIHLDYPLNANIMQGAFDRFLQGVAEGNEKGENNADGKEEGKAQGKEFRHSMLLLDLRDYTKAAKIPRDATAYSHRWDAALLSVEYRWDSPILDSFARDSARRVTTYIKDEVRQQRFSNGVQEAEPNENGSGDTGLGKGTKVLQEGQRDFEAVYPNIGNKDDKLESVFGDNLARLRELKRKYDPLVLWDKWYPITPAPAEG